MLKAGSLILFLSMLAAPLLGQETAEDFYKQALEFKKNNKCNEAESLLQKAVTVKPDFGEAWFELGWCQSELFQYQKAIASLKKADNLIRNNYKIYYELGHAYYYADSIKPALKYFQESVKLKADYNLPYTGIGDIFSQKMNNTKEALKWYLKSAEYDSLHQKTNFSIGWCYNDLGEYKSAIPYLNRVIAAGSNNNDAYTELGFSLYATNQFPEAITTLRTPALAKNELALYYSGLCYVKTGNKQEAVKKYNELSLLSSGHALDLLAEIKAMK